MAETPVGTSVPKWRGSKFVKANMTNDMVFTLAKVKEMYEDEKIVLTADDHTDTEMIIT